MRVIHAYQREVMVEITNIIVFIGNFNIGLMFLIFYILSSFASHCLVIEIIMITTIFSIFYYQLLRKKDFESELFSASLICYKFLFFVIILGGNLRYLRMMMVVVVGSN
jgi:hypothetical protein